MIKLNPAQENKANSLLLDLGIRARMLPNSRADEYGTSRYGISLLSSAYESISSKAAQTIMQTITRRTFNFAEVDSALASLKSAGFSFGDSPKARECSWSIKNVAGAAKFLAWICQQNRIYWNDIGYTPAEREAWVKGSNFAYYLHQAECFASQPSTAKKTAAVSLDPTIKSTRTSRVGGGAPKSGYKSAGPQSGFVSGLVGKPGEKISVSESIIFCILGDKAGTITPKAFIHPVENPAVGEHAKVNKDGLPIVKFGAGNGYTDLAIFSTSPSVMEGILSGLKASGALDKYSGVKVVKTRNDASGYFKINTEYGEVLVKPTKLNEKFFMEACESEEACESLDTPKAEEPRKPAIEDMDLFVRDSKLYD